MNDKDRNAWYDQHGRFVSQEAFHWQVVAELDKAGSLEEARAIQAKYAEQFVYNPDEEEIDIAPYIPSSTPQYAYICNQNGDVEIAGEVRNFNDVTYYAQLLPQGDQENSLAKAEQYGTNHVYSRNGNEKCWVDVVWGRNIYGETEAYLKLTAHHYVGWWKAKVWNKYAATYILQSRGDSGNWTYVEWLANAGYGKYVGTPYLPGISPKVSTGAISSGSVIYFAKIDKGYAPTDPKHQIACLWIYTIGVGESAKCGLDIRP